MAFFRNNQVNWLNLHYGLNAVARTGGDGFLLAFLLRQGFSAPLALASISAVLAGRFVVRPMVLPLAIRFGLRPLVIVGTVLVGCQFPLLARVHRLDATFAAFVVVASIADALYWTCYHAYFAALGDAEHRGHQIAIREALGAVAAIVGPLSIGFALNAFGPGVAFGAAGAVLAVSALPLLATPDAPVAASVAGGFKASLGGVRWFLIDGWSGAGMWTVWQVALFISLKEQYAAMGGAVALAALAGAVSGMALGRWIDRGHGRRMVWIAIAFNALGVIFRAAAFGSPVLAVAASAAGAIGATLYIPVLMTAVYNQAKLSPCPLRFHLAAEGGYDAGAGAGGLVAAGLLALGWPMGRVLLLPLLSLATIGLMLLRYYAPPALARSGTGSHP
jgi:MFS family permease